MNGFRILMKHLTLGALQFLDSTFLKLESYDPSPQKYADAGQPGYLNQLNPVQPIATIDLSLHSNVQIILQLWQITGHTYVHFCYQHTK